MFARAEVVLFAVAVSLAALAFAFVMPRRTVALRIPFAAACCAAAGLAPLLLYTVLDPARAGGTALWEWSAVGGPTVQASYELDGLAAIGLALGGLYVAAALVATSRVSTRHLLLRPIVLLNGFVFITLAVTEDLIAVIVVLGALAALTSFIALLVSPAPAVARVTAYLAAGVQLFVVAALLVSRFGGASFRFDAIAPTAASPGVVLAASMGAALFAGLYPFVPWGYRQEETGERESLRGLLTMPAGLGALLVLVRVLGVTRIDLPELRLPGAIPDLVSVLIVAALAVQIIARRRRPGGRRRVAIAAAIVAVLLLYPYLRWSHVVLVAALLTVAYAAAVSLALPERWTVARYDVVLATLAVALATGSSTALAGALVVLAGGALGGLAEAFWMEPHRGYMTATASSTVVVAGVLATGMGVFEATDPVTMALAAVAVLAVLGLELAHAGRGLGVGATPTELDISAAIAAFLGTIAVVLVLALPLLDTASGAFGRPIARPLGDVIVLVPLVAVVATLLVVVARSVRPFLPELSRVGARLEAAISVADPVPAATASFRALAGSATTVSRVFALFEERAGVWLALMLIATLLVWALR